MDANISLLTHSLLWLFLGSALVGAAASRATRRAKKRDSEGRKDRIDKWVAVAILLSLAGVCGTIGFRGPEVPSDLDRNLAYATAFFAFLSFLVLRFKRAVGLPILGLSALAGGLLLLLLQSLVAFTGGTEIGEVTVLSNRDGVMKLEVRLGGQESTLIELDGEYFAPVVKVVIFDDYRVFLGRKTWYRFEGMTSFYLENEGGTTKFRQSGTDYYFPQPSGISEALFRIYEENEGRIPGVKSVQVDLDLKRVRETEEQSALMPKVYSLMLQNDGGIQIVLKDS